MLQMSIGGFSAASGLCCICTETVQVQERHCLDSELNCVLWALCNVLCVNSGLWYTAVSDYPVFLHSALMNQIFEECNLCCLGGIPQLYCEDITWEVWSQRSQCT